MAFSRQGLIKVITNEGAVREFLLNLVKTNCVDIEVFKEACFRNSENKFFAEILIDIIACICPEAGIINKNKAIKKKIGEQNKITEIEKYKDDGDEEFDVYSYLEGRKKLPKKDAAVCDEAEIGYRKDSGAMIDSYFFKDIGLNKTLDYREEMLPIFKKLKKKRKELKKAKKKKADKKEIDLIKEKILKMENKIISGNLRLAVSIAKKYIDVSKLEYADLIQEGIIGLAKAAQRFDHKKGAVFSTYATYWVRQNIQRAICDLGRTIRIPVYMTEKIIRISTVKNEFLRTNNRYPSNEELHELCGLSENKIKEIEISHQLEKIKSLDAPFNEDDDSGNFYDIISENLAPLEELSHREIFEEKLKEVLEHNLLPRECTVIICRFGLDGKEMTLEELGDVLKVSRERIRQIEAGALLKLRKPNVLKELQKIFSGISDEKVEEIVSLRREEIKLKRKKNLLGKSTKINF